MIEGSQPRKFITKTVLTNPSLYSVSVTSLFDPDNKNITKIYEALEKKQQVLNNKEVRLFNELNPQRFARQASMIEGRPLKQPKSSVKQLLTEHSMQNHWDSLQQAEKNFAYKKQKPTQVLPRNASDRVPGTGQQGSKISRGYSLPSLYGFHYSKTTDIRSKQSKPYNIITNA